MNVTTKKSLTGIKAGEHGAERAELEVAKVGVSAFAAVSVVVSLWAAACFVGGLVSSGGPVAFVQAWFSAVIGG